MGTEEQGKYPVLLPADLREALDEATQESIRKLPQEIIYSLSQYHRYRPIIELLTWLAKASAGDGKPPSTAELVYKLYVALSATQERKAS